MGQDQSGVANVDMDQAAKSEAVTEGIKPINRPKLDTNSNVALHDSTSTKEASDEQFVGDFLAELKEVNDMSPSVPAATRPTRQPSVPLQAAPAQPPAQARQPKPGPRDKAGGNTAEESGSGRVVINHSTHIPGLLPVLQRLVQTKGIRTAVPGRLYTAGGNEPSLALRITVPTEGGFKLLARKGSQTQEVFVVTDLELETMQAAIAWAL